MQITNQQVYGIEESIIASGYPMSTKILKGNDYEADKFEISYHNNIPERAITLGSAKSGSGHDCYLKGIVVQADLTCSQVMHMQILRYHFLDVISSQSKMHKLVKMDVREQVNEYVYEAIIYLLEIEIENYNKMVDNGYDKEQLKSKFLHILYNCPMGLELTFRITTNYLQLKTIYNQRKNHKLPEWREFCEWIEELPHFKELTGMEG